MLALVNSTLNVPDLIGRFPRRSSAAVGLGPDLGLVVFGLAGVLDGVFARPTQPLVEGGQSLRFGVWQDVELDGAIADRYPEDVARLPVVN